VSVILWSVLCSLAQLARSAAYLNLKGRLLGQVGGPKLQPSATSCRAGRAGRVGATWAARRWRQDVGGKTLARRATVIALAAGCLWKGFCTCSPLGLCQCSATRRHTETHRDTQRKAQRLTSTAQEPASAAQEHTSTQAERRTQCLFIYPIRFDTIPSDTTRSVTIGSWWDRVLRIRPHQAIDRRPSSSPFSSSLHLPPTGPRAAQMGPPLWPPPLPGRA